MISVVLPIHNERESLASILGEIEAALAARRVEIVAVDDASTDGSLDELRRLRSRHPGMRIITLAPHAGQSAALMAGIDAATGDTVLTLDADGQNDPADGARLLDVLDAAPHAVAAVGYRVARHDSRWKVLQSRIANTFRNWITGDRVRDTGCGVKAMRRVAVVALPRFNGMHRFFPTLLRRAGGEVIEVPVSTRPRRHGTSKYGMRNRAIRALRDAFGVRWLLRRAMRFEAKEDTY